MYVGDTLSTVLYKGDAVYRQGSRYLLFILVFISGSRVPNAIKKGYVHACINRFLQISNC
jgi:hypothetical protein